MGKTRTARRALNMEVTEAILRAEGLDKDCLHAWERVLAGEQAIVDATADGPEHKIALEGVRTATEKIRRLRGDP